MKAVSLRRHIWVGSLFCGLMLSAALAFAEESPVNGGTTAKSDATVKQELLVQQQQEPATVKKKPETAAVVVKEPVAAKPEQRTEVKKENASNNHFSFSFLYYLFYKGNFADHTNNALRASWNLLIDRLLN